MKTIIKENLELISIAVGLVVMISAVIWGAVWLLKDPYHYTATYCNPSGSQCAYLEHGTRHKKCAEWWDDSGFFDAVNNLKLVPGSCKITKQ